MTYRLWLRLRYGWRTRACATTAPHPGGPYFDDKDTFVCPGVKR